MLVFVFDDRLSLKTIEDHPKFGRVHFLFVGPTDECVNNHLEKPAVSSPKLSQWSQDMDVSLAFANQPPPPRIPPHLLNIHLNRMLPENVSIVRLSFVSHCCLQADPHLLPEPNSVMLRHLYALSIQVIGRSHRCSFVRLPFVIVEWHHDSEHNDSVQTEVLHHMLLQAELTAP